MLSDHETPPAKTKMPRLVRVCIIIGFLSVTVLPMVVLGLAWRQYKIEKAQQALPAASKDVGLSIKTP
jgi:hypothetical protein